MKENQCLAMESIVADDNRVEIDKAKRLNPASADVYKSSFDLLHCRINDQLYRGVFCLLLFPVQYPDQFVSLHYINSHEKDIEIGIIENLADWPEAPRSLIRNSLQKQYYEHTIERILTADYQHGLLFFTVVTRHGKEELIMRWDHTDTEEYGVRGKVLRDAFDNRYIIPDINALPAADRRRFTSFIYW